MPRTGNADLPLHTGRAPRWRFARMTAVVCGALQEGLREAGRNLGLFVAGGKGRTSRQTPREIEAAASHLRTDPQGLLFASRMAAKVDNHALQDGFHFLVRPNWTIWP